MIQGRNLMNLLPSVRTSYTLASKIFIITTVYNINDHIIIDCI